MNVADWNEAIFLLILKKKLFLIESGWWKKWLALKYFEIHFLLSKTTQEWVYRDTFESAINFGGPGMKSSELRTNHNWKTFVLNANILLYKKTTNFYRLAHTYIHIYPNFETIQDFYQWQESIWAQNHGLLAQETQRYEWKPFYVPA